MWDSSGTYYEYSRKSSNAPIVFVHGVGLDHKSWRYLLDDFSSNTTLTYDLLGHGQTKRSLNSQSFRPFMEQLDVLLDELNISEINLVGFSLGGLVAAHYAASKSQTVRAFVLISTVYQRTSAEKQAIAIRVRQAKEGDWTGLRTAALSRWFSPEFLEANPSIRQDILFRLQENKPDDFLECYELLANSDEHRLEYRDISMPTLILTGDGDQGSTPGMARRMARAIPNARASVLRNARHLCIIENHRAISVHTSRFLKKMARQR